MKDILRYTNTRSSYIFLFAEEGFKIGQIHNRQCLGDPFAIHNCLPRSQRIVNSFFITVCFGFVQFIFAYQIDSDLHFHRSAMKLRVQGQLSNEEVIEFDLLFFLLLVHDIDFETQFQVLHIRRNLEKASLESQSLGPLVERVYNFDLFFFPLNN